MSEITKVCGSKSCSACITVRNDAENSEVFKQLAMAGWRSRAEDGKLVWYCPREVAGV